MNGRALPILLSLPRLIPALLRHLGAYAELAGAEAHNLASALARRVLIAAVALLAALIAILLGAAWLLIALWDTPYRSAAAGSLFGLFAAISIVAGVLAARGSAEARGFAAVRKEWEKDRELLESLATEYDDAGGRASSNRHAAAPQPDQELSE